MFLTQFIGRDGHLIFEIETAQPATIDVSDMIGEVNVLSGKELITIRVGKDEMLNEKGLPYFRVEQIKTGEN